MTSIPIRALALGIVLSGCSMCRDGKVTGRLESTGTAGTWVLTSGTCDSGQHESYFGVVAKGDDDSGIAIKLVKDAVQGWTVLVNDVVKCRAGYCTAIPLTAKMCTAFAVDIQPTNTTVNDIRVLEGSLTLDCGMGAGSLTGQLTFDGCK